MPHFCSCGSGMVLYFIEGDFNERSLSLVFPVLSLLHAFASLRTPVRLCRARRPHTKFEVVWYIRINFQLLDMNICCFQWPGPKKWNCEGWRGLVARILLSTQKLLQYKCTYANLVSLYTHRMSEKSHKQLVFYKNSVCDNFFFLIYQMFVISIYVLPVWCFQFNKLKSKLEERQRKRKKYVH